MRTVVRISGDSYFFLGFLEEEGGILIEPVSFPTGNLFFSKMIFLNEMNAFLFRSMSITPCLQCKILL